MMTLGSCTRTLLIVDDSEDDVEAVLRALRRECAFEGRVERCPDGSSALAHLDRCKHGAAPWPGLILLDLNMPGIDGRTVLAAIKGDPALSSAPVVVLTTSDHHSDIADCYRLGANSMIRKPIDFAGLATAMRRLTDYWFGTAILPIPPDQAEQAPAGAAFTNSQSVPR